MPIETYRPSFDELFDRFWGNFEPFERPKAEQLESLTAEAVVSSEEESPLPKSTSQAGGCRPSQGGGKTGFEQERV
jgi:hypothetical protein